MSTTRSWRSGIANLLESTECLLGLRRILLAACLQRSSNQGSRQDDCATRKRHHILQFSIARLFEPALLLLGDESLLELVKHGLDDSAGLIFLELDTEAGRPLDIECCPMQRQKLASGLAG